MKITIGYTLSDREHDYIPFDDGYRPGARQEEVTVELTGLDELDDTEVAELVFVATNAFVPSPRWPDGDIVTAVGRAVAANVLTHHSSLSKGDTVTVRGVRYECASTGFERVAEAAAT
jgi:hypothetical protein